MCLYVRSSLSMNWRVFASFLRSHVFNLRIEKNDLSGVAEVAPIVKTNRMMTTTFSIILRLPLDKDLTMFTMSLKLTGNSPLKMTGSNSNSHGRASWLKSTANFWLMVRISSSTGSFLIDFRMSCSTSDSILNAGWENLSWIELEITSRASKKQYNSKIPLVNSHQISERG